MEEKNNVVFTAKEARQLADTTPVVLKRIYKIIKDAAQEGRTVLHWSIDDYSSALVKQLKANLLKAGYSVVVETYETGTSIDIPTAITISW